MEAILNKAVDEDDVESVVMACAAVADRADWPKVAEALVPRIKDGVTGRSYRAFANQLLMFLGRAADAAVAADVLDIDIEA